MTPDKWVVLKIEDGYKVFGSIGEGYLTGAMWQLNSGIARVEDVDSHFLFHGHSGSVYTCRKGSYGVASLHNQHVLSRLLEQPVNISLMSVDTDWLNLLKESK